MSISDVAEHLRTVPIFEGCSKKDLQTIARQVREISHDAGYVIATEGDPGAGLFVIADGEAEMALLDGGPRTATVTSTTPITLYALTEWVFRGLLAEHPTIAMRTLETMAARLRGATKLATA